MFVSVVQAIRYTALCDIHIKLSGDENVPLNTIVRL